MRSSDGKAMSGPPAAARRSVVKRRITLAVLTLVNSSNFWQRNLLYALARLRRVALRRRSSFLPLDRQTRDDARARATSSVGVGVAAELPGHLRGRDLRADLLVLQLVELGGRERGDMPRVPGVPD